MVLADRRICSPSDGVAASADAGLAHFPSRYPVGRQGLEPWTNGLKIHCSAN